MQYLGSFQGTERFEVQRRIGEGGMGVVYQAYDRKRKALVALKTLRLDDAAAIYRFKREFRSLADINHPNLVTLHELVSAGTQWFFTMELIDGVDFLSYVRELESLDGATDSRTKTPQSRQFHDDESLPPPEPTAPHDYERLRPAICQLAEGVHALHQVGKLQMAGLRRS